MMAERVMSPAPIHPEYSRLLECPVCMEPVNNHRCLPCQHVFCQGCLEPLVQGRSLSCPVCREDCVVKNRDVSSFPRNLVLVSLLDKMCVSCRQSSKEIHCDHCSRELCADCYQQCGVQIRERRDTIQGQIQSMLTSGHSVMEKIQTSTVQTHNRMTQVMKEIDDSADLLVAAVRKRQKQLKSDLREGVSQERNRLGALYNDVDMDMQSLEAILREIKAETGDREDYTGCQERLDKWQEMVNKAQSRREEAKSAVIAFRSQDEDEGAIKLGEIRFDTVN